MIDWHVVGSVWSYFLTVIVIMLPVIAVCVGVAWLRMRSIFSR